MKTISYSNGETKECRLEVWEDNHCEKAGFYRLFWTSDGRTGSPAIGYCSPGGSYRTIKAAIADGVRLFGETAKRGK